MNAFPLISGTKQGWPQLLFSVILELLAGVIRQQQKINKRHTGKEKVKTVSIHRHH